LQHAEIKGLVPDWTFVPSAQRLDLRLKRAIRRCMTSVPTPARVEIRPVRQCPHWWVYFVYAPTGELTPAHVFTLARLRDMGGSLLVICAAPSPTHVPQALQYYATALYWKHLNGYDFSAYTLALEVLSSASPGASACVLNDSVFGPFSDLRPTLSTSRWELLGFTASHLIENHIQSYAFALRSVTRQRLQDLRSVLPQRVAYSRPESVVLCQEVPFARTAARHMTVGACWFAEGPSIADPTLIVPEELLDADFPFLKRSLFGKHSKFQAARRSDLEGRLHELGHPPP
jgi:hypothetical protein